MKATQIFRPSAFLFLLAAVPLCAQSRYLPLKVGNKWSLTSAGMKKDMSFEVVDQADGAYHVRWNNPWIKAQFGFMADGERVILSSLDMGSGDNAVPGSQVQFDFEVNQGKSWKNALGTFTVTKKNFTLSTPAGQFDNCITIRGRDKGGMDTIWTFAPNVGFVQWGEGGGAFLLKTYASAPDSASRNRPPQPTPPPARDRNPAPQRGGNALLGLDSNPPVPDGYSASATEKAFRMAVDSGVGFFYISPKWNEIETGKGKYKFNDFDGKLKLASNANIPTALNIRVIDTNNKALPSHLSKAQFDDSSVIEELKATIKAVHGRAGSNVKWFEIGNEINAYLDSHRNEIPHYVNLIKAVLPTVRQEFPNAQFTVNFTFDAYSKMGSDYRDIASMVDVASFTYYPLDLEFRMREPSTVDGDVARMIRAANGKDVFIQEVGYPSDAKNASSEDKQAQFIQNFFRAMEQQPKIAAANFVWMSDLPESVVNEFSKYYRLANSDRFKAYISTLGLFDRSGRPKKGWAAFQEGAAAFKGRR